jgi:hypothetical protein
MTAPLSVRLQQLEKALEAYRVGGWGATEAVLFTFPKAIPDLIAAVRERDARIAAVLALRPMWTRDGNQVIPYKNFRAALAPLTGPHTTDEEAHRG